MANDRRPAEVPRTSKEMLRLIEQRIASNPGDPIPQALGALFRLYEFGPTVGSARQALADPAPEQLQRQGVQLVRMLTAYLTGHVPTFLADLPPLRRAPLDQFEQVLERRRETLVRMSEKTAALAWQQAVELVTHRPDDALAIFETNESPCLGGARTAAIMALGGHKGNDVFFGIVTRRTEAVVQDLNAQGFDPTKPDDDLLLATAARQYHSMHLLVAGAVASVIVEYAKIYCSLAMGITQRDLQEDLAELGTTTPSLAARLAAELPFWGDLAPLLAVLAEQPLANWPGIAAGVIEATELCDVHHRQIVAATDMATIQLRDVNRENRRLQRRVSELEHQLRQRQASAVVPPPAARSTEPAGNHGADPLADLQRTIDRLRGELAERDEAHTATRALLDTVITNPPRIHGKEDVRISPEELRQVKGVVIGGHPSFIKKLRRSLPACTFYSADQKRITEQGFAANEFVIFYTGYCNHALANNALALCRQHQLPTGYSAHVNIEHFLDDVARIMGYAGVTQ